MADNETPQTPVVPVQTEADLEKAQRAELKRLKALEKKIFSTQEAAEAAAAEVGGEAIQIPSTDSGNGAPRWAIVPPAADLQNFFERTQRARGGYISKMENQRMRPQGFRGGGIATRGYGRVRD